MMATSDIVYSTIGGLFTLCLASLGFLAVRLITQYDKFQTKTSASIAAIRSGIRNQEKTLDTIKSRIQETKERSGVDKETKTKISALLLSVAKIEQEIKTIKPYVNRADDDHGKVIVLDNKLRSQEKNLKTLFDTVKLLAQRKHWGQ